MNAVRANFLAVAKTLHAEAVDTFANMPFPHESESGLYHLYLTRESRVNMLSDAVEYLQDPASMQFNPDDNVKRLLTTIMMEFLNVP